MASRFLSLVATALITVITALALSLSLCHVDAYAHAHAQVPAYVGTTENVPFESMLFREGFNAHSKPLQNTTHELVFAVHQLNVDVLERELLERSTPGSPKYQKWLTFDQVGKLVTNQAAFEAVKTWLTLNNIEVVTVIWFYWWLKLLIRLPYI
jgi:subtilase family serine protease